MTVSDYSVARTVTSSFTMQRPAFIAFLVIFSVLSAILAIVDASVARGSMEAPRAADGPAAAPAGQGLAPAAELLVQVPDNKPLMLQFFTQLISTQNSPCQVLR